MTRLLIPTLMLLYFMSNAAITGRVYIDKNNNGVFDKNEEGAKDVSVSDLTTSVKTNNEGLYQLSIAKQGNFIMISLPSGFTCKNWWSKVSSADAVVDFPLTVSVAKSTFTFIQASDTHISEKSLPRMQKLREIVDANKPDFVLVTGDLVRDALRVSEKEATGYYDLYVKEIQ